MKKIVGFLAILLGLALVTNCTNEPETKRAELTVAPTSVTYDPNVAASNIVAVNCNTEWTVSPSHADLKLDKTRGNGNGSIAVLSIPAGKSYSFTVKTITGEVYTNEVSVTVIVNRSSNGGNAGGGEQGGSDEPGSGNEPSTDPNVGKLVYKETFGTQTISGTTYADTYTKWSTTGSGASSVTYESIGAKVRNDDYGSKGKIGTYEGASGGVYVRLYEGESFTAKNITLPAGSVNYSLSVGGGQPASDMDIYVGDGDKWVKLTYNNTTPYNTWKLGKATFTLSKSREKLSIRLIANKYQQHGINFDDISLTVSSEAGQVVNIEEGSGSGGDSESIDVTKMGWAELPEMDNSKLQYVALFAADAKGKSVRNYSMGFDKSKKAALWVAYPMHTSYTSGNAGRTDDWVANPLISIGDQANVRKSYTEDSGSAADYNRGHQIASADRQASAQMNAQTFYFSNSTPQQSAFNGGIWGTLENAVRNKQCSDTLYVVTGAHFASGVTMPKAYDVNGDNAPVPTHYYKVLLRTKKGNIGKPISDCSASELIAIGFLMEHPKSNTSLDKSFKEYAVSVEEIEELTGHTFFPTAPAEVKSSFKLSDWNF